MCQPLVFRLYSSRDLFFNLSILLTLHVTLFIICFTNHEIMKQCVRIKKRKPLLYLVFFSGNKFIWRCPIITWYCHLRWPRIYNHLITLTNISYQKWHILVHTYEPSTFQEFSTRHCINVNIHYTDIYIC